jgi:hypothetical protein
MKTFLLILLVTCSLAFSSLVWVTFFTDEISYDLLDISFLLMFLWGAPIGFILYFYSRFDWNDDFFYLLLKFSSSKGKQVKENLKNELDKAKDKMKEDIDDPEK